MENWIHNLDSFYVTKDDQKINSSDENLTIIEESEEKAYNRIGEEFGTEPVKIIHSVKNISGKKIVRIIIILSGYLKWMRILKRYIFPIVLYVKTRMVIQPFLICKVY